MSDADNANPDNHNPNPDAAAQAADNNKPRRGRPPKAAADAAPAAELYTEQVTYLPGEGDPTSVKWGGITLHANVPKEIEAHADGTPQQKTMHGLIERARTNKFFHVGEFDAKNAVAMQEQFAQPKTPEQYRAHAVRMLPKCRSEGELDHWWMSEEPLRQACGVGADDLEWLSNLIAPIRHELHKAAQA